MLHKISFQEKSEKLKISINRTLIEYIFTSFFFALVLFFLVLFLITGLVLVTEFEPKDSTHRIVVVFLGIVLISITSWLIIASIGMINFLLKNKIIQSIEINDRTLVVFTAGRKRHRQYSIRVKNIVRVENLTYNIIEYAMSTPVSGKRHHCVISTSWGRKYEFGNGLSAENVYLLSSRINSFLFRMRSRDCA